MRARATMWMVIGKLTEVKMLLQTFSRSCVQKHASCLCLITVLRNYHIISYPECCPVTIFVCRVASLEHCESKFKLGQVLQRTPSQKYWENEPVKRTRDRGEKWHHNDWNTHVTHTMTIHCVYHFSSLSFVHLTGSFFLHYVPTDPDFNLAEMCRHVKFSRTVRCLR